MFYKEFVTNYILLYYLNHSLLYDETIMFHQQLTIAMLPTNQVLARKTLLKVLTLYQPLSA